MSDSPVEHALSLLVSGDPEEALRFSAAALESEPSSPAALIVTARALWRIGNTQAAIDGFRAAAWSAARAGDVPLAIAAIADVRAAGFDAGALVEEIASVLAKRANGESARAEPSARRASVPPIGSFLTRRALVSRAEQMIHRAGETGQERKSAATLFDSPSASAFRDLSLAFETVTVPAGYRPIEEGEESHELYVVASGRIEIERREGESGTSTLARLENGALLGELAVLAPLPAPSSAVTACAAILLVASRAAILEIAARSPSLGAELEALCREQAIVNLGSACSCMSAMPSRDRGALVERMTSRLFARGERLVHTGDYAEGLHLVLSGQVALVAHEGGERVVMLTLGAGQVVGEAELVLCQPAITEAVAACPTATLFLPQEDFFALALDYPSILHGLYAAAVGRHRETEQALAARAAAVVDSDVTLDDVAAAELPPHPPSVEPPAPEPATPITVLPVAHSSSSVPSSLAPFSAAASLVNPVSRRFAIVRRSAQGAAVVAVAAGVAAVLATGEEHAPAFAVPQTHSFGGERTARTVTDPPPATGAASAATEVAAADSTPVAAAAPATAAPEAPPLATFGPPSPSPQFLMSSLKKRSREAARSTARSDAERTGPAAPGAEASPDPDFGGRE